MKKEIRKNTWFVTTEKRMEKKKFFSKKHKYAIVTVDDDFMREYEVSDNPYIETPTGEKIELEDYSTTFIAVFRGNKVLIYGEESPLLYLPSTKVHGAASLDDAMKNLDEGGDENNSPE